MFAAFRKTAPATFISAGLLASLAVVPHAMAQGQSQAQTQVPTPTLSPEQTANLYMAALVNDDTAQARQLDDYLRPGMDGKDAVDVKLIGEAEAHIALVTADHMKEGEPPQLQHKVDDAIDRFTRTLVAAVARTKCSAVSSSVAPNSDAPGRFVATVNYTCLVPDAQPQLMKDQARIDVANLDKMEPAQFNESFRLVSNAYAAAQATKPVSGVFHLYSDADRKYWISTDANDVLTAVSRAILTQIPRS